MKKLTVLVFIALSALAAAACTKDQPTRDTRGDETVYGVSGEDAEMNAIIDRARKTVDRFLAALDHPKANQEGFVVKYPFKTDPGSKNEIEHIWLNDFEKQGDGYTGVVNNEPFYIKAMKLGDRVPIDMKQVSDWAYVENGWLVGGESIVYFYDRMSDEEKKDFDANAGFKIRKK
jgi:uncharacterized protein YegJ (DUF2314 family)